MKNLIGIIVLMLIANLSLAQCKYKGIPKNFLKYSISKDRPNPDKSTKPKIFFDKMDFTARISAAQAGDQKYLYFHFARANSKRFDINTNDPLELTTKSGKKVVLQPSGNYQGKKVMLAAIIGAFYEVSPEQIEILASEQVHGLKLNITSEKPIGGGINVDAGGWNTGPKGDSFYKTKIQSAGHREKLVNLARCLKSL